MFTRVIGKATIYYLLSLKRLACSPSNVLLACFEKKMNTRKPHETRSKLYKQVLKDYYICRRKPDNNKSIKMSTVIFDLKAKWEKLKFCFKHENARRILVSVLHWQPGTSDNSSWDPSSITRSH